MLVELYVKAINTPGAVPNVELAWNVFVKTKCCDAQKAAVETYKVTMTSQLDGKLPCDSDNILKTHTAALYACKNSFMEETMGISTNAVGEYLIQLKDSIDEILKSWHVENARSTKEVCNAIIEDLQKQHLDPILRQLNEEDAHDLSFQDIIDAYDKLKEEYERHARGAKDVISEVFMELHSTLNEKRKHNLAHLNQVQRYNQRAIEERIARAYQEKLKRELQETNKRLLQENDDQRKEMKDLIIKQREEQARFRKEMENRKKEHQRQMRDLDKANEKKIKDQRKELYAEKQKLYDENLDLKKENEKNLRTIKSLCDSVENPSSRDDTSFESAFESMSIQGNNPPFEGASSSSRPQALFGNSSGRSSTQTANIPSSSQAALTKTSTPSEGRFITHHTNTAGNRQMELDSNNENLNAVEKPDFLDNVLTTLSIGAPTIGAAVSAFAPPLAPIASAVGGFVGLGAAFVKKARDICSIM